MSASWYEPSRAGRGGYGRRCGDALLTGTVTTSPSAGESQAEPDTPLDGSPPGSGETPPAFDLP